MSTTTVGKGKSKGMLQGRQAAAKAKANGQRVADINAERGLLNRTACVTYLQTHGVYSGHSRDNIVQLRQAVADHKAGGLGIDPEPTTNHLDYHPEGEAYDTPNPEHVGEWTSSSQAKPGTWVADAIKGRPANGPAEYRQVAEAAMVGVMRRLEFTDGTARSMGAATKVFVAPGQLAHCEATEPTPEPDGPVARTARAVPDDHPLMRYVDAELVGQQCPEGLVHSVDASGLVRVHKATCKPALPALAVWPERVYAAACCKPRTPGATARTVYVPPSKRTA